MKLKNKKLISGFGTLLIAGALIYPGVSNALEVDLGVKANVKAEQKSTTTTGVSNAQIDTELKNEIKAEQRAKVSEGDEKGLRLGIFNNLWNSFSNRNQDKNDSSDVELLIIKNLHVQVSDDDAKIKWRTNVDASATFMYSTSADLENAVVVDLTTDSKQTVSLSDLNANTTYYYKLIADSNLDNNGVVIKSGSFTTDLEKDSSSDDTNLLWVRTHSITDNSATIAWITLAKTTSKVWIEADTEVDTDIQANIVENTLSYFHKIKIENLEADTTYHFKVASTDDEGNVTISTIYSFTTENE